MAQSASTSFSLRPSVPQSQATVTDTATEYGVHDTFRHGPRMLHPELIQAHPLEQTLKLQPATENQLKMNVHRRLYGIHAPLRLTMERQIVSRIARFQNPASLKHSNLALDILMGKDETLDVEDFLGDADIRKETPDVHAVLAKQLPL
ncbi:hypothetical protein IWQ61_005091 [Dispira simplex]|nr:hypothetical protein IWQ61_005091 [Dispira simplex]